MVVTRWERRRSRPRPTRRACGAIEAGARYDHVMRKILTIITAGALVVSACSSDDTDESDGRPTVVVTTSVWGDAVASALGDTADVQVIIPVGADPHDFAPSARQAEQMENADLLVVNGLGLEASMTGVIDNVAATGTPVLTLTDTVDVIEALDGVADPHIWMDPERVATAVDAVATALSDQTDVDATALAASVDAYRDELAALDGEMQSTLSSVPAEHRALVTNHDALEYFADAYGFEVVGTVIPSNTTNAAASASDLVALADLVTQLGVPAIFAETTESDELANVLADEVGGSVVVVELYTGSLGEPGSGAETYIGMMRSNAGLLAGALG